MGIAAPLADADEERKPEVIVKSEAEEANGDCTETKDAMSLVCANNYEDSAFYVENLSDRNKVDDTIDLEVDVLGCMDSSAVKSVQAEDVDATEHSSSFGDTFSGFNDGSKVNSSDAEVESQFCGENGHSGFFDGFTRVFRKKKMTAHWRRFIRPLMWRCKWIELRMKELHSQALLYDKELAGYEHDKELQSKVVETDKTVSRSVPLSCRIHRKQAMKRRRRKRNENTVDLSSYTSHHNIFSYYENKRSETDGLSVDDDSYDQVDRNIKATDDIGANYEASMLGFSREDSSLEQVLLNIEAIQSRVVSLKVHLNKLICSNVREISSASGTFIPGDPSPNCSPGNIGDTIPVGAPNTPPHQISEYDMEDLVLPESAVSSYGDAAELDIFESPMALFSAGDVSLDQHQIREFCKDIDEDILINNQAADEELQNFEVSHPIEKPQELPNEEEEADSSERTLSGPETEEVGISQQPTLKPCFSGRRGRKRKRKRGGLNGGLDGWRKRRASERS